MSETEYALYQGDSIVTVGTASELAEYMGVNPDTVRWYATDTAKKRQEKKKRGQKWEVYKICM